MKMHFGLLVICSVIVLGLLDYGDAYRCSRRYTCYKPQQWKTTHYRACGWLWRRRCTRHATYFNKYIQSTCVKYYNCPVNGGWSSWSSWNKYGSCSRTCRIYGSSRYPQQKYYKRRSCNNPTPQHGGRSCSGSSRQYTYFKCNTHYCKINGGWSSWSSWSKYGSCSASCRTYGSSSYPQQQYYKRRSCTNPKPRFGGRRCSRSSRQYKYVKCNTNYCIINGGWSSWSSWSKSGSCSASCRKCGSSSYPQQKYYKRRSCTNPTPRFGGRSCSDSSTQYTHVKCNTHYCKSNGGWGSWTSWGKWNRCSADCRKEGSRAPTQARSRSRMCNNPSPRCNGKSCSGSSLQYDSQICNTHCCRVDGGWGSWTSWGTGNGCSADCRREGSSSPTLTRSRSRKCNNPSPKCNGKSCSGSSLQSNKQACNTQYCPVDGGWTPFGQWSDWSECSKSCDGGSRRRTRKRSCTNPSPKYGGKNCADSDSETAVETCNTFTCPSVCVCTGSGDPHYYTPDGAAIHFMGTCKYTLWKSTIPNDRCDFRVETKNERRYGNNNVAWTRFIDFYMQNTKIRILRGGTTLIDGVAVGLPSVTANNTIEVTRSGSYVTAVNSKCNIRVQFDGVHLVDMKVSKDHFGGNLTGICGNCNGYVKDDYQTKEGVDGGYAAIGNSYKVLDDQQDPKCADAADPEVCPEEDKERAKSDKNCGFLLSDSSPFKVCRDSKTVDFNQMYSSCEFDICSSDEDDVHCQTLESTALACSQHGFQVKWRTSSFCPLKCNGGFVYKTSVSCTNTCDNPTANQNCLDPPVDGCTCPDKTYLNGGKCVTMDKCGSCSLTIGGTASKLAVDDIFPKGDCRNSQRCDFNNGTFKLVNIPATKTCSVDEWCILNGLGEYNCEKKPVDGGWEPSGLWLDWSDCSKSCDGGSRRRTRKRSCTNPRPQYGGTNCAGTDSETAVETCNTFRCPDFCTCDGSGDPHYYTPDGALIHFMGTCKYTLWNSTIANDPCEFRVETKNERRHGDNNVAWTRFIDFYMKNIKIRFLRGGTTLVNGIKVSLPNKVGSSNIEISRSGSYVTAFSSECNIRVQFDGNHLVSVKAERVYYGGKLAGICGNCNGIYGDDLQTKDGKDVSSSGRRGHSEIGNSYKVFDDVEDPNSSCDDGTPLVEITDKDREKSEIVCQYLVSDSSPFKACRESNKLNFTKMYESCEYDVAVSTLDDAHCPTLQSTALACSRHGYPVHWRNSTFCPLACDGDFVYKTSVSCTNTCDKPKADQNCLDPPVDGCTCPDKTYLSGDRCVAIDKCGSCDLIVGHFSTNLAVGDVSPKGDCRNTQRCDLVNGTFKLVTVPATKNCSAGEWCILNGLGEYNCAKKPAGGTGSKSTASPLIDIISGTTTPKYTITTDAEGKSGSTDLPANTPEMTTTTSIFTTQQTSTESNEDDQFEQSTVGDSDTESTSASTIVDATEKETTGSVVTPTTTASEVTTTTPASEVKPTTPASEVKPTTPASEVTPTTPSSTGIDTGSTTTSSPLIDIFSTTITPVSEVTPTTPVSVVTPTTPVSVVTPTTPVSVVTPTTPVSEVTTTSPASDVTSTTHATEVTPTSPASDVTTATPASEVTPTTRASEVTPTTLASDVTTATSASEVTPTTPASDVTPTTLASDVTPTTPASEVTPTTPASDVTPTTPASDVTPTKPASDVTPTTPASDVTPTTPASEVTPTTPNTPPASSTAIETTTTTSRTTVTTHETYTESEDDPLVQSTAASSVTPTTHNTTPAPSKGFKCKAMWGYYPDPDNCKGFIQCKWWKPIKMPCAKGTIWSQKILTCIHGTC